MTAVTVPRSLHLPPRYVEIVLDILRRYLPQAEVWAYGSRVNGDHYDASDLDLVARQPDDLTRRQPDLDEVAAAFSDSDLPILIQIVDWARIPPAFREEIEAGYVVLQPADRASAAPTDAGLHFLAPTLERGSQKRSDAGAWKSTTIATFGELIDGGVLDVTDGYRAKNSELGGTGLIFLRAGHVTDTHIDFAGVDRFRDELTPRLKEKLSKAGDVAVTTKGNSTGRTTFVTPTMPVFVYSPHLSRWRSLDHDQLEPGFLRYWSNSREFDVQLRGMAASTDMAPYLSLRDQRRLEITLPPIDEQRAIAGILGALDDKIQQNRRTAQALERLARAIFRAWFVDFEPVKAKAAGATSFPSMPQPVFDALPVYFDDCEIGPVPKGWEIKTIGEVVTVKGGGTPSTKKPEYWEGGVHWWATPRDMSRLTHPILLDTERRITDVGVQQISSGLLPVGTVLMSSRAPVGYLAIAQVPTAINQGFIAMVCDGPLPSTFVLNWASASMDVIKGRASGTTFPEINKKNFRPLPVVQPSADVVAAYREIAEPLLELMTASIYESAQLAQLRDYLLPKLLSGAICVNDAERILETTR